MVSPFCLWCPYVLREECSRQRLDAAALGSFHAGVSLPLPPWPGQLPGQRERSYENCRKIKHLHTKY